jgi:hypothetical protein
MRTVGEPVMHTIRPRLADVQTAYRTLSAPSFAIVEDRNAARTAHAVTLAVCRIVRQ